MTILAIDPGPKLSAFVLLDGQRPTQFDKLPNDELLQRLPTLPARHCVIEMVQSFGMAVGAEVFETVFWTGRFFQHFPGTTHRLYRSEVKMHLCHSMRAKDANIRQALIDHFGGSSAIGTKKSPGPLRGISGDCWSALAIGITFLETRLADHDNGD